MNEPRERHPRVAAMLAEQEPNGVERVLPPPAVLAWALLDLADAIAANASEELADTLLGWRDEHKYRLSRICRDVSRETLTREGSDETP